MTLFPPPPSRGHAPARPRTLPFGLSHFRYQIYRFHALLACCVRIELILKYHQLYNNNSNRNNDIIKKSSDRPIDYLSHINCEIVELFIQSAWKIFVWRRRGGTKEDFISYTGKWCWWCWRFRRRKKN